MGKETSSPCIGGEGEHNRVKKIEMMHREGTVTILRYQWGPLLQSHSRKEQDFEGE